MMTSKNASQEERNGQQPSVNSVVSNVAGFGENVLSLTELQAKLALVELRQNIDATKTCGAPLLAGLMVALAALPVALAGVAELLVSELGLKRGFALLGVALVAILLAAFSAALGIITLRRQRLGFPRSSEELNRNVNWLRAILRHSGRAPTRPARG